MDARDDIANEMTNTRSCWNCWYFDKRLDSYFCWLQEMQITNPDKYCRGWEDENV